METILYSFTRSLMLTGGGSINLNVHFPAPSCQKEQCMVRFMFGSIEMDGLLGHVLFIAFILTRKIPPISIASELRS